MWSREYMSITKFKKPAVGLETSFNKIYIFQYCIDYLRYYN